VLDALKRRGVDAHAFDPRATALSDLVARRFGPRLDRAARSRR